MGRRRTRLRPHFLASTAAEEAAIAATLADGQWEPAEQWIARTEARPTARADQASRLLPRHMAIGHSSRMSLQLLRCLEPPKRRPRTQRIRSELVRAVTRLGDQAPKQQAVLLGVYVDGKPQAQIAAEQDTSEPGVSQLKQKAESTLEA
jgi:DNA-directed RNA polymerase specialized sigma subunit